MRAQVQCQRDTSEDGTPPPSGSGIPVLLHSDVLPYCNPRFLDPTLAEALTTATPAGRVDNVVCFAGALNVGYEFS
jgi:hypothetical protein